MKPAGSDVQEYVADGGVNVYRVPVGISTTLLIELLGVADDVVGVTAGVTLI